MQKKAICLGFYDRGTGKHQSNTVFSFKGGVSDNHDSRYYGIPTDKGGKALEKKIIRIGQASNDGSQAGVVISRGGCCFTICACTHGYAIGNVLRKYEKKSNCYGRYRTDGERKQR